MGESVVRHRGAERRFTGDDDFVAVRFELLREGHEREEVAQEGVCRHEDSNHGRSLVASVQYDCIKQAGRREAHLPVGDENASAPAETRARVIGAAEACFVDRGYATTTIVGIAEAADVSPETVYAIFGTSAPCSRRSSRPQSPATPRAASSSATT